MKYSRSSFAAVTLEEFIYVLGGQGTAHLCTVERYDTKLGKWEMMPAMSTKRINFGAAQLHGFIFVVGKIIFLSFLNLLASLWFSFNLQAFRLIEITKARFRRSIFQFYSSLAQGL